MPAGVSLAAALVFAATVFGCGRDDDSTTVATTTQSTTAQTGTGSGETSGGGGGSGSGSGGGETASAAAAQKKVDAAVRKCESKAQGFSSSQASVVGGACGIVGDSFQTSLDLAGADVSEGISQAASNCHAMVGNLPPEDRGTIADLCKSIAKTK